MYVLVHHPDFQGLLEENHCDDATPHQQKEVKFVHLNNAFTLPNVIQL